MNNKFPADAIINACCFEKEPDMSCIDKLPLAMAYVPLQKWRKLYEAEVGFDRGTIFSELDLPFLGRRAIER